MSHFRKIEPAVSLADEVYSQVVDAITAGAIVPHERIIQEKLADELQVSRTPVREALLRLEHEGVLVRVGRSGFTIRAFTDDELLKVYQAREAIEGHAAGILSQQSDSECVRRLETLVTRAEALTNPTVRELYEANRMIHRAFVDETGNLFLLEMFDSIWNRSVSFFSFAEIDGEDLASSMHGHLDLCEAVSSGSESVATQAMRQHVRDGLGLQRHARERGLHAEAE